MTITEFATALNNALDNGVTLERVEASPHAVVQGLVNYKDGVKEFAFTVKHDQQLDGDLVASVAAAIRRQIQ